MNRRIEGVCIELFRQNYLHICIVSAIYGKTSHKFRHNFADTLNPLCPCCHETEDTEHYFPRCKSNLPFRTTLMNDLNGINTPIAFMNPKNLLRVILHEDKSFNKKN